MEAVRRHLDSGVSVDLQTSEGWTALMLTSFHGRTEVVRLLLGKGAAVDEKDNDGKTALMLACGHMEVVQLLLRKGAVSTRRARAAGPR